MMHKESNNAVNLVHQIYHAVNQVKISKSRNQILNGKSCKKSINLCKIKSFNKFKIWYYIKSISRMCMYFRIDEVRKTRAETKTMWMSMLTWSKLSYAKQSILNCQQIILFFLKIWFKFKKSDSFYYYF